nr:biopolymer transport protein ExbD/TolR [Raoultella sp. NCTC 9187]
MAMHFNENLDDNGEMHDINVTPFIDVMLVLLIIFYGGRSAGDG